MTEDEAQEMSDRFNQAYCRPYGPLTERDTLYWEGPLE